FVAYLFSPFALEWSRASIIDYLAVAPTLGAIAAARRAETTGRSRWWVLAAVLGVVSALVKITTAVIWLVAALVIARGRRPMLLVCAIAFAAGFVWTEYADSIRQTGPLTRLFSSSTLTTWTLGAPLDRIDPTLWALWIWHLTPLGVIGLIGLVFIRAVPGDRRLWVLSGIAMALAYAVFPTLFAQHSYYAVAVSPAVALLLGAAWRGAILARPRRFVLIATAALAVGTFAVSLPKWIVAFGPADPDPELGSAAQIQAPTNPDDGDQGEQGQQHDRNLRRGVADERRQERSRRRHEERGTPAERQRADELEPGRDTDCNEAGRETDRSDSRRTGQAATLADDPDDPHSRVELDQGAHGGEVAGASRSEPHHPDRRRDERVDVAGADRPDARAAADDEERDRRRGGPGCAVAPGDEIDDGREGEGRDDTERQRCELQRHQAERRAEDRRRRRVDIPLAERRVTEGIRAR